MVRNAGVLGRISQGNKDYNGLLSDLEKSMMGASLFRSAPSLPNHGSPLTS